MDSSGPKLQVFARRPFLWPAAWCATLALAFLTAVLVALSLGEAKQRDSADAWRRHHEECLRLPEELYHRDRFRAIEGHVTDEQGDPVRCALVRCAALLRGHVADRAVLAPGRGRRSDRINLAESCANPPLANPAWIGVVRGFAPHPFLPALIESPSGGAWLGLASDASEFEVQGPSNGPYRVRALDLFGRVTFASGVYPDAGLEPPVRLWNKIDLDELGSREVVGFVRWESGLPAAKAPVVMQNSLNFRKFVRRVETDDHGFYRFDGVPGNEPYFIFALPPGEENAMRNFEYFSIASRQREVWHDQTLHPHRVTGTLFGPDRRSTQQLVRVDGKTERVVSSFQTDAGRFTLGNVPHGRYRVQESSPGNGKPAHSLPFEIGEGREEAAVRWPEAAPQLAVVARRCRA